MNTQLLGSYFGEMVHQDYSSKQSLITWLTFRSTWRGLEMDSFEEHIVLIDGNYSFSCDSLNMGADSDINFLTSMVTLENYA